MQEEQGYCNINGEEVAWGLGEALPDYLLPAVLPWAVSCSV